MVPDAPPPPTNKLMDDAAPSAPVDPAPAAPKAASSAEVGGDLQDGFIHLKLSPEGTKTTPDRPNIGTSRGPNITLPLQRLNLMRNAPDDQVLRAVAGFTGLPLAELEDCEVLRFDNKMHAIEVHRPMPGQDEVEITTKRQPL